MNAVCGPPESFSVEFSRHAFLEKKTTKAGWYSTEHALDIRVHLNSLVLSVARSVAGSLCIQNPLQNTARIFTEISQVEAVPQSNRLRISSA
jgi:hypothetical protein